MLYIEENLIYSPEKCYESEHTESVTTEKSNNESTKESINGPLVLPQSTLEDTYFKTIQEPTVSEKYQNLPSIAEENTQASIPQNNLVSTSNTDTLINNCTNPFLQDILAHNEVNLDAKSIMELWNENLRLQVEITTTLKTIFSKVLSTAVKSESDNLIKNESVNRSNIFLHTNDNTLSTNCANINVSNTCQDTPSSNANTWNENLNLNIYSDSYQNTNTQNGNNSILKKVATNVRVPPGYENYYKVKFDEQYAANQLTTQPTTANNSLSSNAVLRETNPFKCNLAEERKILNSKGDDNRSDSICLPTTLHENQTLISDYDAVIQRFVERSNSNAKTSTQENAFTDTLCNRFEHYFNSTANSLNNNIKNESFVSNAKSHSSDCNWNIRIDDLTNTLSGLCIDNQDMQHAAKNVQEMEQRIGQYVHSFSNPGRQECVVRGKENLALESQLLPLSETQTIKKPASDYDLNKCRFSTKIPTDNLDSISMITNNTNFDEGYFTRPSTSQTAYTSSPLLQVHNNTDGFQQLSNKNANKTADMWAESFQNTAQLNDWNKGAFLSEKTDQTMMHPKNHLNHGIKSLNTGGVTESFNNDNTGIQNSPSKGNLLQNTAMRIIDYLVYFQVIDLTTGSMHIIHYQGEGWLLTDEFFKTFTKFESSVYALLFLYEHKIKAQYKQIDRTNDLIKFINIGSILSKTTYEKIYNKNNVHLTQLKSAIEILNKLQMISNEGTNNAVLSESVAQDIWLIDNTYKHLKYRIENTQQL